MTFTLRSYQQASCDAALDWLRKSTEPCLIDAAPAAGKSFMIAYVANKLIGMSGKNVLCLAPSAELVKQNFEKYLMTGEYASIFSASAGAKSTRHPVVFGTPGTVKNSISRFQHGYCAVVIDECHGISPTIKAIIEEMRASNPLLRVLGLSGTPYRLGDGYIFRQWPDGRANGDDTAREPYFAKCVYRVSAREMLEEGFITPMTIGAINAERYDTSELVLLPNGHFNQDGVERAFEGHGRKTAMVVADVIEQARERPGGIMYFAATVRHAHEIMASLPPENRAIVTGETPKGERERIIKAYREQKIRHLVNCSTLTTGFDVTHTETIALLRKTESAALLQQIMGRAWRLHPGKGTSLLLDYADNVDEHFPDGDIYQPVIKAGKISSGAKIEVECPECAAINDFSLNKDYADFQRDRNGYCLDTFGQRIMTEYGPMAAHHGRRCFGMVPGDNKGEMTRCGYYWTSKICEECDEPNDIAARYCRNCKSELVNPNDKIIAEFKALKRDPYRRQCDRVISMMVKPSISQRGNQTLRVDWVTEYRSFSTWFMPEATHTRGLRDHAAWAEATLDGSAKPETISYMKDGDFYRILGYNAEADSEGLPDAA